MNLSTIKLHLTTMSTVRKVECIFALLCIITLIIVMAFVAAAIAVGVVLIVMIIVYIFRLWRYLPSERHHVQSVALAQQRKNLQSAADSLPHLAHLPQSHIMLNTDPYYQPEEQVRGELQQNYANEIYTNNEPFPSSFEVNNAHVAYPRVMPGTPQAPSIIHPTNNNNNNNNIMNNVIPVMTEDNAQLQYYQSASLLQQQQQQHQQQRQLQQQYLVLRNANREPSQQTVPAGTVYTNNNTQVEHRQHVPYQIQWMPQSVPHSESGIYQFDDNNNNDNNIYNDHNNIPIMDNVNQDESSDEGESVNGCSDTCENENTNNNGDGWNEEDEEEEEEEGGNENDLSDDENWTYVEEDEVVYSRVIPWINDMHAAHALLPQNHNVSSNMPHSNNKNVINSSQTHKNILWPNNNNNKNYFYKKNNGLWDYHQHRQTYNVIYNNVSAMENKALSKKKQERPV